MNTQKVIEELTQKYPGKNIVKNGGEEPTEIICEVEPTSSFVETNVAIAVIDKSQPHYHVKAVETYEVMRGELIVNVSGKEYQLKEGDVLVINPRDIHFAIGNETWVKVSSKPGWTPEDHILV